MTECWSEGELRAYLDRELPPEELERAAAHLEECAECARTSAEVAGRAQRVANWMDALAAAGPATRRAPTRRRWVAAAAAGALAAGLAIGALLTHKRVEPRAAGAPPPVLAAPAKAAPQPEVAAPVTAARVAPVRRPVPRRATRHAAVDDRFLALDDEPFETGVVWRVALGPGQVPADVIFGPDGRARAIRLVNYKER